MRTYYTENPESYGQMADNRRQMSVELHGTTLRIGSYSYWMQKDPEAVILRSARHDNLLIKYWVTGGHS